METENSAMFFARIRPLCSNSDFNRIRLAYELSKNAHRGQVRQELDAQGAPLRYFEHPRRVALIIIDKLGIFDPAMIIGGLFHDGFEDTTLLAPDFVQQFFGDEVSMIVQQVTKTPENKRGFVDRLIRYGHWKALGVKVSDRCDNLCTLPKDNPEFIRKQTAETRREYFALCDRVIEIAPGEYRAAFHNLKTEIVTLVRQHEDALAQAEAPPATDEDALAKVAFAPLATELPLPVTQPCIPRYVQEVEMQLENGAAGPQTETSKD